ncbi:MAG: helix-hairpin-helix domain-containing protein [Halobacterium sp.]
MGLLSKLKSMLGMESDSTTSGSGVDVTVEREPAAESERAVKEPEGEAPAEEASEAAGDVEEPVATESEAAASTESLVDEEHAEDPTRAAEPAEAAIAEDESGGESDGESEDEAADGEPVSVVKGIGPAYAERLEEAGIHTVDELADADPEDVAERTDLSAKRVGRWVENAQDRD